MAGREFDIEPRDQSVHEIVSPTTECKGLCEGEVGGSDSVEIEGDHGGGVGNDGFHLNGVDEGLGEGGVLEGGEVEAVDVVPDFVALVSDARCWGLGAT